MCDAQVDFDFADFDVLKRLDVKKGRLIGGEGEAYRYLVLPPMELTPEMSGLFSAIEAKGVKICTMCDPCFADLNCAPFGSKFSTASALVMSFDRHDEGFCVDLDAPHNGVVCLCREVNGKYRYLFVNSKSEPIDVSCILANAGNARLYSPLDDTYKPVKITGDEASAKFEFNLGAYEVLIVTE